MPQKIFELLLEIKKDSLMDLPFLRDQRWVEASSKQSCAGVAHLLDRRHPEWFVTRLGNRRGIVKEASLG